MHKLDAKLALWADLYGQLRVAQARLKGARQAGPAGALEEEDLAAEVTRLQYESDKALRALQAEFVESKKARLKP